MSLKLTRLRKKNKTSANLLFTKGFYKAYILVMEAWIGTMDGGSFWSVHVSFCLPIYSCFKVRTVHNSGSIPLVGILLKQLRSCIAGYTTGCQKWKGYCGGWSLLCAVLSFMLLNILKLWTSSCEERGQVVFTMLELVHGITTIQHKDENLRLYSNSIVYV